MVKEKNSQLCWRNLQDKDMNINHAPCVTRTETAPITIDPKSLEFVNCPMQTPVNQDGEYQLMIALPVGKGL